MMLVRVLFARRLTPAELAQLEDEVGRLREDLRDRDSRLEALQRERDMLADQLAVSQVEVKALSEVAERDRRRVQAEAHSEPPPPPEPRQQRSAPMVISPGPWQ
jgi:chromosome segregation ATPase